MSTSAQPTGINVTLQWAIMLIARHCFPHSFPIRDRFRPMLNEMRAGTGTHSNQHLMEDIHFLAVVARWLKQNTLRSYTQTASKVRTELTQVCVCVTFTSFEWLTTNEQSVQKENFAFSPYGVIVLTWSACHLATSPKWLELELCIN